MVQASLLLPMNTVQTQMQYRGVSLPATMQLIFANGPLKGLANLYRAIAPTVGMLGARQGLKFGSGAAFKRRLPLHWPEPARDACAGGLSALTSTTLLFPIDTLKTRWQMGMATPRLDQVYQGFRGASGRTSRRRPPHATPRPAHNTCRLAPPRSARLEAGRGDRPSAASAPGARGHCSYGPA